MSKESVKIITIKSFFQLKIKKECLVLTFPFFDDLNLICEVFVLHFIILKIADFFYKRQD